MHYGCPNLDCSFYQKKDHLIKDGTFWRANDSRLIQRYKCSHCGRRFSNATYSLAKGQKKRRVNETVRKLLGSCVSMRRIAKLLSIRQITVKRKLLFLAEQARMNHAQFLDSIKGTVEHMQFDDMITSEHTKLKPLTISLAVDVKTRKILGAETDAIPAFGRLAELSRKKYGYRKSQHQTTLTNLFERIKFVIKKGSLIQSDEHSAYPPFVKKYFNTCEHRRHKGGRGCIVGQGELKKLHYDPLFILNHTCGMLRANMNRLARKTWCTTKDPQMLKNHLDLFIDFYNNDLLLKI
jgi:transposase-like protein